MLKMAYDLGAEQAIKEAKRRRKGLGVLDLPFTPSGRAAQKERDRVWAEHQAKHQAAVKAKKSGKE